MDRNFINVLMLGFGFMFLFTSFQTMGNIEKTILDSIKIDNPEFNGDGYTSLAIIYAVLAVCNWLTPSAISICGPRGAMVIGASTYCLFMASFFWPQTWLLYLTSGLLGVGAALIWTGQGTYLSRCSDSSTISRNSGIFWAIFQTSLFFGNLFVYFQFQGKTQIDYGTRQIVFTVLISVAIIGIIFLSILRPSAQQSLQLHHHQSVIDSGDDEQNIKNHRNSTSEISNVSTNDADNDNNENNDKILDALKNAIKLFFTKDMLLLSITFLYTGFELSFYSGVYSNSIGFTLAIGESTAKQLVGLSGICIGLGEVTGGVLFGILGSKTNQRFGRDAIVCMGFILHVVSFVLIYLNLPNSAPFGDTKELAYFQPPLASVALTCSFMLGIGDACYNTQIYSMLGGVFAKQSAAAFALFKFTQSVAAAASFVYSSHIGLSGQMGILLVFGVLGTACFCVVEWSQRRLAQLRSSYNIQNKSNSD